MTNAELIAEYKANKWTPERHARALDMSKREQARADRGEWQSGAESGYARDVASMLAEIERLDTLAKAERALRVAEVGLCCAASDNALDGFLALNGGCQDARRTLVAAGGEP